MLNSAQDRLEFMETGRRVRRYHTLPQLDYQPIDGHSWGVAMLVQIIVGQSALASRLYPLTMAALVHDLAEYHTGDLPAPAKRKLGVRDQFGAYEAELLGGVGLGWEATLDAADKRVLKIADAAEGCLQSIHERKMGNKYAIIAFKNFWSYLHDELGLDRPSDDSWGFTPEVGENALRLYLRQAWVDANEGAW